MVMRIAVGGGVGLGKKVCVVVCYVLCVIHLHVLSSSPHHHTTKKISRQ